MTRSPLHDPTWTYVGAAAMDDFRPQDWAVLTAQRAPYQADLQAAHVMRLLSASKDDPSFGYHVNNYRHSVQAATLALADGRDEDYVVATLLHDIGFIACPTTHGAFAARLLAPYVDEKTVWIVEHHPVFLDRHCEGHPTIDRDAREMWRGHPHFEAAAEFVARYDQNTVDADAPEADLSVFEPLVRRVFARPPRSAPARP